MARELAADVDVTMQLWRLEKPTIASCAAGAWPAAWRRRWPPTCCVCTPDARFGEPEIRYGSGPVALLMPYVLNQRVTRELLFTGDTIDADEALRVGLVNRIVEAERSRRRCRASSRASPRRRSRS